MIALAQSLSLNQPGNGWFIPNCNRMSTLLKSANIKQRKEVRVHEFDSNGDVNVLQAMTLTNVFVLTSCSTWTLSSRP